MRHAWVLAIVAACGDSGGLLADGHVGGSDADTFSSQRVGIVAVANQSYQREGSASMGGYASASFTSKDACTTTTMGACLLQRCPADLPAVLEYPAGVVSITGTTPAITLAPPAGNGTAYPFGSNAAPYFSGGETLAVSTTGGSGSAETVPAFTASVTAPSKLTITSPAAPAEGAQLPVDRTQPMTITWTGGGSGELVWTLAQGSTDPQLAAVCSFDASAGTGSVPAAVLGLFTAGNGSYEAASRSAQQLTAGEFAITFEASFSTVWPDDTLVSGATAYSP